MNNLNPIGVFDSGVGGLSVLQWIRKEMPNEDLIYIADSVYAPYGNRNTAFIKRRAVRLTEFLLAQKAKAIVVACNTATAASITALRETFDIPIIGIEPGVKPALSVTNTGKIGILATTETLKSTKFDQLITRFCTDYDIYVQDCPGLVEQVEKADFKGDKTRDLLDGYLSSLLSKGADTIVLGCTHYIFLKPLIEDITGKDIRIIDTGAAVAKEVGRRLHDAKLTAGESKKGSEIFFTGNAGHTAHELIKRLWNKKADVRALPDELE